MAKKGFKGSLEKQLKVYSAAAAGVLALAPSANAAIHYSGLQNLSVGSTNTPRNIDLNGDTITDFRFRYTLIVSAAREILMDEFSSAQDIGHGNAPTRLSSNYQIKGALVNPSYNWGGHHVPNATSYSNKYYGNFNNATGYIGVRFHIPGVCTGSDWNYGWIRYQGTTVLGSAVSGNIIDWAYEDQCNTAIAAGAGIPAPEPPKPSMSVPTLNQWGMIVFMLLLGGLAARMLQKQEKEDG